MSSDKNYTRREFGCIAAACFAGNVLSGNFFMRNNTGVNLSLIVNHAVISTAQDIIRTGAIGRIYLGHSFQRCDRATDITALHESQLLLLCETIQPGQVITKKTIAVPSESTGGKHLRALMTTIEFSHGMRIEATTTLDIMAHTGSVIRGNRGSLCIQDDTLQLVSLDDQLCEEIAVKVDRFIKPSNRYSMVVHQIINDAKQHISA